MLAPGQLQNPNKFFFFVANLNKLHIILFISVIHKSTRKEF